jgi:hypothetical protein
LAHVAAIEITAAFRLEFKTWFGCDGAKEWRNDNDSGAWYKCTECDSSDLDTSTYCEARRR